MRNLINKSCEIHKDIRDQIYQILCFHAKASERIEIDKKIVAQGRSLYFCDFYIPLGIESMKILPRTMIEYKINLLFDSISRINKTFEELKTANYVDNCIVIYESCNCACEFTTVQDNLKIINLEEFISWGSECSIPNQSLPRKDWKSERNTILEKARLAFEKGNNTLVLGAGVSIDAGLPSWDELLRGILSHKSLRNKKLYALDYENIQKACANSSIITARYLKYLLNVNNKFYKIIRDVLYKNSHESVLVNQIVDLIETTLVKQIITYNYDDLIEQNMANRGINCLPIFIGNRLMNNELPIYHVHGLITQNPLSGLLPNVVLTEEEYHELYRESFHWSNIEQLHSFSQTTCFFIGLSMSDPNLRRLLEISYSKSDGDAYHYAFLKRNSLGKKANAPKDMIHIQTLEGIYRNLGVNIIWYEDHQELPNLLAQFIANNI